MAWKDVSTMSQRWKFVVLASAEGANVSELCRRFGVSRKTGYKWLSRYAAERVFTSFQRYLTQQLKLVINEPKSRVRPACGCEFLGFAYTGRRVTITVSPKKLTNFTCGQSQNLLAVITNPAMRFAMPNKWLEQLGLFSLQQLWCDFAPLRGTA